MFNQNRACQHLRLIGLPANEAARFSNLINKWHNHSGPEWTAERLKTLEAFAKSRYLNGLADTDIPIGWAVSRSRKYPKRFSDDLLHELFTSEAFDLEKALNFCRLSSGLSLFEKQIKNGREVTKMLPPSPKQLSKFIDAVQGPVDKVANMHLDVLDPYLVKRANKYPKFDLSKVIPMICYPMSDTSAPYYSNNEIKTVSRSQSLEPWDISILYKHGALLELLKNNIEYFSICILGEGNLRLPYPDEDSFGSDYLAGTITPIQELGCKLRPAANPMIALQAINEPLKQCLAEICKRIPEIVTFNQQDGKSTLQGWLSQGEQVWSLDASSFTDRFPLEFQLEVLKKLQQCDVISPIMYETFKVTSDMRYWFEPIKAPIQYKYGQPQGLGPSFHLATLSHYELLESFCLKLNLQDRPFRILGDDIIIKNAKLAHLYQQWMSDCNVDINLSKSIISNKLGEFAGSQITPLEVISRPKLKEFTSNDAVVSYFDSHILSAKDNKFMNFIFEEHKELTDKLSLPEDFGGRRLEMYQNFNPHLKELSSFSIVKARILKELDERLPYRQESVVSFLESKERIHTRIIDSIKPYLTTPVSCNSLIEDLNNADTKVKSKISMLDKAKIQDYTDVLLALRKELKRAKSIGEIKVLQVKYKDMLSHHGYLMQDEPALYKQHSLEYIISKLVYECSNEQDPMAIKRKDHKKPTNTGWKRHLQ